MKVTGRTRRERARRGVLAFTLLTVLLHSALAIAVGFSVRLRDPLYGDKAAKLMGRINAEKPERLLLAIGTSRLGMGFDGREIEKLLGKKVAAFNFGLPGMGPIAHRIHFERLLKSGVKPDLLLLEILPPLIQGAGEPVERRSLRPEMVERAELELLIGHGYKSDSSREIWNQTSHFPLGRLRYQILGRLLPSLLPADQRYDWSRKSDPCGWNACPFVNVNEEMRQKQTERTREDYGWLEKGIELEGGPRRAFEEILAMARERGIPAKVVWMPEGSAFRQLYPPDLTERLEAMLEDWRIRFGSEPINARLWVPDCEFLDGHHLMQVGAARFSRKLAERLVPAEVADAR